MDMTFKFFACFLALAFATPITVFILGIRGIRTAKSAAERKAILRMFELLVPSLSIHRLLRSRFLSKENEQDHE